MSSECKREVREILSEIKIDLASEIETIVTKTFAKYEQQLANLFQKCSENPQTDNDSETSDIDAASSDNDSDVSAELPGKRQSDYDMKFVPTPTETRDFDLIISSLPEPDWDSAERRDHADLDFRENSGIITQSAARSGQLAHPRAPPNKSILRSPKLVLTRSIPGVQSSHRSSKRISEPPQARHLVNSACEKPPIYALSKKPKKKINAVRPILAARKVSRLIT